MWDCRRLMVFRVCVYQQGLFAPNVEKKDSPSQASTVADLIRFMRARKRGEDLKASKMHKSDCPPLREISQPAPGCLVRQDVNNQSRY